MTSTALAEQQKRAGQMDVVRKKMMAVKDRLFEGAPRHVSANRMITSAMMAFRDNPKLLECTMDSQLSAIRQAAFYGWEIGGPLSQAYLVPYKDTCTLIPGYRGLTDMMRRSGDVLQIDTEVVHACDRFRVIKGDAAAIHHEPSDDPKRQESPITHVYVIVHLRGGAKQRSVWTAAEIDYHKEQFSQGWKRAESSGKKDSPWHTHWQTMAHKTVLIAMVKRGLVPVSGEIRESLDKDESVAGIVSSTVFDAPQAEIVSDPPKQIEAEFEAEADVNEIGSTDEQAAVDAGAHLVGDERVEYVLGEINKCKTAHEISETVQRLTQGMPVGDVDIVSNAAARKQEKLTAKVK